MLDFWRISGGFLAIVNSRRLMEKNLLSFSHFVSVSAPRCRALLLSLSALLASAVAPNAAASDAAASNAAATSTAAQDQTPAPQSLLWLTEHAPGPKLQVLDINDSTFEVLASQLPAIPVRQQQASIRQVQELLQARPDACVGNKLVTAERRQWGLISHQPQVVFPGLRLFVREDSGLLSVLQQRSKDGSLSVRLLLAGTQRFRLGYAAGRSYGEQLDKLFGTNDSQRFLWPRTGPDQAGGLLQMLSLGRIDFLLEYPNVVSHYWRQLPDPPPLQSFAIDESPAVLKGHIICADTPQGRALLSLLDHTISVMSHRPEYLAAHLRWFEPAMQPAVLALYNQAYGTRFQLPAATEAGKP